MALVDMGVWHWMYEHPAATPAELKVATIADRQATCGTATTRAIFGTKDVVLLGIYSHMIHSTLYLPDYPIGHLIAFQIEQQMEKAGAIGPEFERMATAGNIAPDLWMKKATGAPGRRGGASRRDPQGARRPAVKARCGTRAFDAPARS